jgi:hypothetical protein
MAGDRKFGGDGQERPGHLVVDALGERDPLRTLHRERESRLGDRRRRPGRISDLDDPDPGQPEVFLVSMSGDQPTDLLDTHLMLLTSEPALSRS